MNLRVGLGYDIHPLVTGERGFYLGGVKVSREFYLFGHSDGDVLTHAIVDALLGAAHLGNIGGWFPENELNKNRRSLDFLSQLKEDLKGKWEIVNIDSVVIVEVVRLNRYVETMERTIADALGVSEELVSVKPKSGNGSVGDFVQSHAICFLKKVG